MKIYKGNSLSVLGITVVYLTDFNKDIDLDFGGWLLDRMKEGLDEYRTYSTTEFVEKTKVSTYDISNDGIFGNSTNAEGKYDHYTVHCKYILYDFSNLKPNEVKTIIRITQYNPDRMFYVNENMKQVGTDHKTIYDFSGIYGLTMKADSITYGSSWVSNDFIDSTFPLNRLMYQLLNNYTHSHSLKNVKTFSIAGDKKSMECLTMKYIQGDFISVPIEIYLDNNMEESINRTQHMSVFKIGSFLPQYPDILLYKKIIGEKLYANYCDDTLIICDNKNGYKNIETQLKRLLKIYPQNIVSINQYHILELNNNLTRSVSQGFLQIMHNYSCYLINYAYSLLNVNLVNADKIKNYQLANNGGRRNLLYFENIYQYNNKNKQLITYISALKENSGNMNSLTIPYDKDINYFDMLIDIIEKFFTTEYDEYQYLLDQFFKTLIKNDEIDDKTDPLIRWFKSCTKNAQSDEEKLLKAYGDLKNNLIKEYKNNQVFLNHYNMSNKKPIPSIETDKKTLELLKRRCVFINKVQSINKIENIRLNNTLGKTQLYLEFLQKEAVNNTTILRDKLMLINNIYDNKENKINLHKKNIQQGFEKGEN